MAGAPVQQKEFAENRGSASTAVWASGAFSSSLTAGNLMTARVTYNTGGGQRGIALSGAGSPTWVAETPWQDGTGNWIHDFYALNIPGGTTTQLTATPSDIGNGGDVFYPAIYVDEWSGVVTTGARLAYVNNVQATPTTAPNLVTSGLLGTLASQPAVIIAATFNAAGVATPASGTGFTGLTAGWTYQGTTPPVLRPEYSNVGVTTSIAATFTAADNSMHMTSAWAFSTSGGPPPPTTMVNPISGRGGSAAQPLVN